MGVGGGGASYQSIGSVDASAETSRSSSEERQRRRLCAIQVSDKVAPSEMT